MCSSIITSTCKRVHILMRKVQSNVRYRNPVQSKIYRSELSSCVGAHRAAAPNSNAARVQSPCSDLKALDAALAGAEGVVEDEPEELAAVVVVGAAG